MDVDYNVIENIDTKVKHLVIDALGSTKTVCGLSLGKGSLVDISMTMRRFWKNPLSCRNCRRAAKH